MKNSSSLLTSLTSKYDLGYPLRKTGAPPYLHDSIDIMAVGNLPNELPRDASRYFGEQLIKYVLPDLLNEQNEILNRATILKNGKLTEQFDYLSDYGAH